MPKRATETQTKNVRSVKRGDVLKVRGQGEQVVRAVSVVLHLANGVDLPLDSETDIEQVLVPDPEVETE